MYVCVTYVSSGWLFLLLLGSGVGKIRLSHDAVRLNITDRASCLYVCMFISIGCVCVPVVLVCHKVSPDVSLEHCICLHLLLFNCSIWGRCGWCWGNRSHPLMNWTWQQWGCVSVSTTNCQLIHRSATSSNPARWSLIERIVSVYYVNKLLYVARVSGSNDRMNERAT